MLIQSNPLKWLLIAAAFILALLCCVPARAELYWKLAQPQYDGNGVLDSTNASTCGRFNVRLDLGSSPGFVDIVATAPSPSRITISITGSKIVCEAQLTCTAKFANAAFPPGTPKTPKATTITASMLDAKKCTTKLAPTIYRSEIVP